MKKQNQLILICIMGAIAFLATISVNVFFRENGGPLNIGIVIALIFMIFFVVIKD